MSRKQKLLIVKLSNRSNAQRDSFGKKMHRREKSHFASDQIGVFLYLRCTGQITAIFEKGCLVRLWRNYEDSRRNRRSQNWEIWK